MKQPIQTILSLCVITGLTSVASAFAETGGETSTTAIGAVGSDSIAYGERQFGSTASEDGSRSERASDHRQKRTKKTKRNSSRSGRQSRSSRTPETNDDTSSMSGSGATGGGSSGVGEPSSTGGGSTGAGGSR